jgi:transposase-like protein
MAMDDLGFQRLLASVGVLSRAQLVTLDATVRGRLAMPQPYQDGAGTEAKAADAPPTSGPTAAPTDMAVTSVADIEARFADTPVCPHCQNSQIIKWNRSSGLQRYRCKPCDRTFNAFTGTPLAQLHKRELWLGHAQALVDAISLRKVAARLDIDLTTAFRWRHRFLRAPKEVRPQRLEGTVEADETYFLYSEKGAPDLKRPARKRGGKAQKPGLSEEQVPVLIARDRLGATTDAVLPDRSAASIKTVLGPVVDAAAILVSDGAKAYRAFADEARILHVELNLSAGERRWGIYHIQNVNNYDSRLKGWMRRFNGVATKYLPSYLGWHRTSDAAGNTLTASRMLAAAWG